MTVVLPFQPRPPSARTPEQLALAPQRPSQELNRIRLRPLPSRHAPVPPPLTIRKEVPGTAPQQFIAAVMSSMICAFGAPSGLTRKETGWPLSGSNQRGCELLMYVHSA